MFLLQVWYAASYAEFVNQKIHDISEEERKGNLGSSALCFCSVMVAGFCISYFHVHGLCSGPEISVRLSKGQTKSSLGLGSANSSAKITPLEPQGLGSVRLLLLEEACLCTSSLTLSLCHKPMFVL